MTPICMLLLLQKPNTCNTMLRMKTDMLYCKSKSPGQKCTYLLCYLNMLCHHCPVQLPYCNALGLLQSSSSYMPGFRVLFLSMPKIGKSESFTCTFIKTYDEAYSKILYEASELSSPQARIKTALNYTSTASVTFRVSILAQHLWTFTFLLFKMLLELVFLNALRMFETHPKMSTMSEHLSLLQVVVLGNTVRPMG